MSEPFANSKPRAGQRVTNEDGNEIGTVSSVEGNLCWTKFDSDGTTAPFIWRFKDGLNALHSWPSKNPDDAVTFCPPLKN